MLTDIITEQELSTLEVAAALVKLAMGEELKEIDPDLVLIDLGTNDFGYAGINAIDYEMKLTKVIEKIRNSSPNASILITSPQDFQFYGGYAPECIKAAEVSKKVAFANKCVFLDGFSITGGKSSIMKWLKNGLSQYDRIHLNIPGYAVKGELYVNAILNSYYYYLQNGKLAKNDLPIFNSTNSNIANVTPVVDNTKTYTPTKIVEKEDVTSMIKYKVKLGDYLGKISEEHNVSLTDLKKWNDLTSNKIYVNQTLTIYTKKSPVNTKINIENNKPKTIVENKSKEPEKKVVSNPTITKTNTKTAPTSSKPTLSKTALTSSKPTTTASKPSTTTASKTPVTSVKKAKWNDINSLLYDSYTMKYGDSLWSVSRAYGMTVDELKKLNNIKEGQMLHPGTVLLVKAK